MQLTFNQIVLFPGQALLLKNTNWPMFEALLEELGEARASRVSYSKGFLEIMVPIAAHERDKELIGDLVKILLEEMNLEFLALGSTTFKNQKMEQAVEPDECFYIHNEAQIRNKDRIDLSVDPPPDLAIEIDITSRTRFNNYELLGIPELWRYDGARLEINVLKDSQYVTSETSIYFPKLSLVEVIPNYVNKGKTLGRNVAMGEFRFWVRKMISN